MFFEPIDSEPAKPEPNSTPLTAGIEKRALAISDSKELKIGSPKPTGRLVVIDSITPPKESPFFLASRIAFFINLADLSSGHLTSFL